MVNSEKIEHSDNVLPAKFPLTRFLPDNCTILQEILLVDSEECNKSIYRVYRHLTVQRRSGGLKYKIQIEISLKFMSLTDYLLHPSKMRLIEFPNL